MRMHHPLEISDHLAHLKLSIINNRDNNHLFSVMRGFSYVCHAEENRDIGSDDGKIEWIFK